MRSTLASSSSKVCSKEESDVSTSIARGWWWPAGADQGLLVAVSFPGVQGRPDETDAKASAAPRLTAITFRVGDGADSVSKSALGPDDAQAAESWVMTP